MQVMNQRPQTLSCLWDVDPTADPFDPIEDVRRAIARPLLTPLAGTAPATVTDDDGNQLDENAIADLVVATAAVSIDADAEDVLRELYGKTLAAYDATVAYPTHRLFVHQVADRLRLPYPTPVVLYTADVDVIQPAKDILVDPRSQEAKDTFFAGLAFLFEPDTLGFAVRDESVFQDFLAYAASYAATLPLPAQTTTLMGELAKLTLAGSLTETIVLRAGAADGNEPCSFARVLPAAMMGYAKEHPETAFMLPFTTKQLFCPEHVVIANVDAHAHALPPQVMAAWSAIVASIADPVRIVSTKHLARLDAARTAIQTAQKQLATSLSNQNAQVARYANVGLSKRPPKPADLARRLKRLAERLGYVNRSQNLVQTKAPTFARANRRNPDDYNLPGQAFHASYRPDIHLYVDTSGSISEADWADAVKTCIVLAQRLDVNLYFTSFSHVMSETTLIIGRNKTARQMWLQIHHAPKVTGGTDYEQIWRYIMADKRRQRELSLIITDFEWAPPSTKVTHPANLYYAPCSNADYGYIRRRAQLFVRNMAHIDPCIRRHLIF